MARPARLRAPGAGRRRHAGALRWRRQAGQPGVPRKRLRHGHVRRLRRGAPAAAPPRHGAGQHVDVSLAYTATMHQSPFLNSYTGKVWDEPRGQEALGSGPLHRLYRAADRWPFLGGGRDDTSRLASVPSLDGAAGRDGDGLIVYLEERIATESAAVWVERLLGAGLGAHTLERVAEVMADPGCRRTASA
ncbi:MAG: CoA transferase [Dehalococcoidia bacterium]